MVNTGRRSSVITLPGAVYDYHWQAFLGYHVTWRSIWSPLAGVPRLSRYLAQYMVTTGRRSSVITLPGAVYDYHWQAFLGYHVTWRSIWLTLAGVPRLSRYLAQYMITTGRRSSVITLPGAVYDYHWQAFLGYHVTWRSI